MPHVDQILCRKDSRVLSIGPRATVLDAAIMMNDHQIGALVVCESGRVVGIITERDVLRRVVARRIDPVEVTVGQVMTHEVVCCTRDTKLDEARNLFMTRRIRHLPVVDRMGHVEGMISIGDLNAWQLDGQSATIHYLREYLYGTSA